MKFTTIANAKKQTGLSYLGNIGSSAKTTRSKDFSHQYTYAVYLSPANVSGYNVCPFSTKECRLGCLATSGRAKIEYHTGTSMIADARKKKTILFHENKDFFMQWLIAEIKSGKAKADRDGFFFSVRLNATSDIDWNEVYYKGFNIFEIFPDIVFYDYTKNHNKFDNIAKNYHLTYSYTGRNWNQSKKLLDKGFNIAVVFNVKKESDLPLTWNGYKVVNGDLTDYRIDDAKGIIVGLKWKNIGNKAVNNEIKNGIFVVQPTDFESNNVQVQTAAAGM